MSLDGVVSAERGSGIPNLEGIVEMPPISLQEKSPNIQNGVLPEGKKNYCDEQSIENWFSEAANTRYLRVLLIKKYRATDAEDIMQDVAIKAINYLRGQGGSCYFSCSIKSWLTTIARNALIDRIRSQRRKNRYEIPQHGLPDYNMLASEIKDESRSVLDLLIEQDAGTVVRDEINKLPQKLRTVIQLRELDGLSYNEIRDFLKIPDGTIKNRLYLGREILYQGLRMRQELRYD